MKLSKKQIIAIILLIILVLATMTGCGNYQGLDFEYTYDKAICKIGDEFKEITIANWTDYEGEQLQLKDNEGNVYLVSSINCTLIKENR